MFDISSIAQALQCYSQFIKAPFEGNQFSVNNAQKLRNGASSFCTKMICN